MQDKKLDDMTKKYKEEMMRLYSKNRTANTQARSPSAPAVPQARTQARTQAAAPVRTPPQNRMNTEKPSRSDITPITPAAPKAPTAPKAFVTPAAPMRDLSHPPMPEIPKNYSGVRVNAENASSAKFPPPGEILKRETASAAVQTVSAMADPAAVKPIPEPRFEPAEEHNQGNYDFPSAPPEADEDIENDISPEESYPNEDTDFSSVDPSEGFPSDNPENMSGQGYLKIEVTTASGAVPVRDATVIITENTNVGESLIGMVITDKNGETPVIPLPAPPRSLSESPDPAQRPYSEYNIGVYKQGFYIVPQLTVPIFDAIKSIQPVSLIPLAEFELEGTISPDNNGM